MYKHKQCLVALVVCVLAAAADAKARLTHASKLRTRRNGQKGNPLRTPPGDAKDCAGNNPTLPRAAERFKTRLAAATSGCQVVVYTTLFYPPGIRLPHPSTRLGPAAYNGSACYLIVAGAASAASLREHCDVSPWRIVEMGGKGVHGRAASRTLKLLPGDYFTGVRYLVFLDWKLSLRQHPFDLVSRTLRSSGDYGFAAFRHPCTTPTSASR
jgi:hypothetical protein